MISKTMRQDPLFMRNSFPSVGKWGIPLVKKQALPSDNIKGKRNIRSRQKCRLHIQNR